jgi:hypothetical protein
MKRLALLLALAIPLGCNGPENGRVRGGGPGGDGGNYRSKPIHAASKIDGTRDLREIESR